jgi:hypothetical protein
VDSQFQNGYLCVRAGLEAVAIHVAAPFGYFSLCGSGTEGGRNLKTPSGFAPKRVLKKSLADPLRRKCANNDEEDNNARYACQICGGASEKSLYVVSGFHCQFQVG